MVPLELISAMCSPTVGGGEERLQGYLSSIASGTELGNYVPSFLSNCPKLLISDSIFKKTKLKAYQV